ncbi:MAG: hypothetical protein MUP49_00880 [Dehalococcoidia bacterium]|nr:hypothetical protein [Dehalococcoidia bacterium]
MAAPSGKLRKIGTSHSELELSQIVQELVTFYPFLLGCQWQTTSRVATWRNSGLVEQLKTEKRIPEEQFSAIVEEIRKFPEEKINVRL